MTIRRKIVDAHHHLWKLDEVYYPWLRDEPQRLSHPSLAQDYLISDYRADARDFDLAKSVHIEALPDPANPASETLWLQSISDDPANAGFPHAIIANADLMADDFTETLDAHARAPNFRGIRQILSWVKEPYLRDETWRANFRRLSERGLVFDMMIKPAQMQDAAHLAQEVPSAKIALNHLGMPKMMADQGFADWRPGLSLLASCQNVAIKISGFGMFDRNWTLEGIRPYVLEAIELFGPARCMFASNFPVERPWRSFTALWTAYFEIVEAFSDDEKSQMFHDNAVAYYRL